MYRLNSIILRKGSLALMITLTAVSAPAASITWTNTAGGNWNTAQNWNPNQVPGSADTVSIPSGGINVLLDATGSAGGLTLETGSSLTVAGSGNSVGITGAVYLYGVLTNFGTITWSGTGNSQFISGRLYNLAGGLVDIQSDQNISGYSVSFINNEGTLRKSAGSGTTDDWHSPSSTRDSLRRRAAR